ncbi:hypothetical protein [Nocardia terpenica]|uniref:Uncharacterized protein n=1 Tax=Nocardia terpenica TaxID=455432 RepID=A0A6G9Z3L6_9NOCA|nr:hypothetical protein [Nocardia terpenica]QIS19981.1 hypothetical protein F6W96_18445 [Nocardia terpenica]
MTGYEDRLLSDLMTEHGGKLARATRPAPRRSRRRAAGIAVGAVALVAAAGIALDTAGETPRAYAVVRNSDGSVTVTITELSAPAIAATNAKLTEMGIPAKVVPMTKQCPDLDTDPSALVPRDAQYTFPQQNRDGSITLRSTVAPPGYVMLLGLAGMPGDHPGLSFTAPVRVPGPSCLYLPGRLEPR